MVFTCWILQIILSELVDVPTTIENGVPASYLMNFYHPDNIFELGDSTDSLSVFENAASVGGDCRKMPHLSSPDVNEENYKICAHIIPEVWQAQTPHIQDMVREHLVSPPAALGALGTEGWYIPRFTAVSDPSLTSYLGYQGPENREKLARMFKRPTTWIDYCHQVSPNNCSAPDGVAGRAPGPGEEKRMFYEGSYTGYFRYTERNTCSSNSNCTGSIGDFPCGWSGATEAVCYHLDIALESNGDEPYSGGYTYTQLGDMWKAANATKNNVIITWAIPDPTYELFQNTDFEFIKVTLPAPSQECIKNKVNTDERCAPTVEERVGVARGVARPLHKLTLHMFDEDTERADIAIQSPAQQVLSRFAINELQMSELFEYWQNADSPRDAVCQWTTDNLQDLLTLVPPTYPRVLQSNSSKALSTVTIALGAIAIVLVLLTASFVYKQRERRVMKFAQQEFLVLLLAGSLSVSVGATLMGIPPSNGLCISQVWLINLGYTLELVPLLVKVAAINQLMHAAQRMRRVKLNRSSLYNTVAIITIMIIAFLVCWTVLDPPQKTAEFSMSDETDDEGATIIHLKYFCSSSSEVWEYVSVGWNMVMILCATAIAFQAWSVKQAFNETKILSRLIYSHFLFVVLWATTLFLPRTVAPSIRSMIFSVDTSVMMGIYFLPKFLAMDAENRSRLSGLSSLQISGLNLSVDREKPFDSSPQSSAPFRDPIHPSLEENTDDAEIMDKSG